MKPNKPRKDFPLFAHANGQLAKKVRGKLHYFGVWADPEAAERRWDHSKAALLSGRPCGISAPDLTIKMLCNFFLQHQKSRLDSSAISERQYKDYLRAARLTAETLGRSTLVTQLRANDFEPILDNLTKRHESPYSIRREVTNCRAIFNYGFEQELLEQQVRFGVLRSPSRRQIRKYVAGKKRRNGENFFSSDQCLRLIAAAKPSLRAMILLGLNCGCGNQDIRELLFADLDLNDRWLDYARPKTGIERVANLWPETVKAINDYLMVRPNPNDREDDARVFITQKGNTFGAGRVGQQPISSLFRKLADSTEVYRPGLTFYSLRRTYRTVVDDCQDLPAVRLTMGHTDNSIDATYRQRIEPSRLERVASRMHCWLFGEEVH